MKSDADIKRDVTHELGWDPDIDATEVAVSVKNGIVTLNGSIPSFGQKYEAERACKRVEGVKGLANDIQVRLTDVDQRPDAEIERDVAASLIMQLPDWYEHITPVIRNGVVVLKGEARQYSQRSRAETAVRRIRGVKDVLDEITIKPQADPAGVKLKIEEALKRNAEFDASHVEVETEGSKVSLYGEVRSWAERRELEEAAWRAPGVTAIDNQVRVIF